MRFLRRKKREMAEKHNSAALCCWLQSAAQKSDIVRGDRDLTGRFQSVGQEG